MPIERKSMAGKPYRPSNGTEGDIFEGRYCARCRVGLRECDIVLRAHAFSIGAPEYPNEWRFNNIGVPMCTAFSDVEGEPTPPPRCPETLDMFGGHL